MEKSIHKIEDQPVPPVEAPVTEEQAAIIATNQKMADSVKLLAESLTKKAQMTGQINVLEIELKVLMLVEMSQVLCDLVIELSGGKHSDKSITETMVGRVDAVTEKLTKDLAAARLLLASPMPPRSNGGMHR